MAIRSSKDIKRKLLKRAFAEGRGRDMILLIQWRLSLIKSIVKEDQKKLQEMKLINDSQPRGIKMLNTLADRDGENRIFTQTDNNYVEGNDTIN